MLKVIHRVHPNPYYGVDQSAPSAPAVLVRKARDQEWVAVVPRCPYCGQIHSHVVCSVTGDPNKYLGVRNANCSFQTGIASPYNLIQIDGWSEYDEFSKEVIDWLDRHFPMTDVVTPSPRIVIEKRIPITTELRADVWDKSRGICWYCGIDMHPFRNFHVDHYIPVIDGGSNELSNLVPACQSCNSRKQARPAEYLRRFIGSGVFWFEREGQS